MPVAKVEKEAQDRPLWRVELGGGRYTRYIVYVYAERANEAVEEAIWQAEALNWPLAAVDPQVKQAQPGDYERERLAELKKLARGTRSSGAVRPLDGKS
jgi:hypothetical protein